MAIGDRIRRHRQEMGLTQQQIGDMVNPPIQKSGVAKWENGRVTIPPKYLVQLEQIFSCDDLVDRSYIPDGREHHGDTRDILIEQIRMLDDYDRGRISAYVETYLRSSKYSKRT